ncbi:MAG: putative lipid II flippase FtsW [bacterium]|nr:putative lipid II flippase FtsW [bacterium]
MSRYHYPDQWLMFLIFFLLSAGLVMVYSSSSIHSLQTFDDSFFYVRRQVIRVLIGLCSMGFFMFFNYRNIARISHWLVLVFTVMLCLVFVPGIGVEAGGGRRWIDLIVRIQPSEYFKVFYIVFLAKTLVDIHRHEKPFLTRILPHLAYMVVIFGLVLMQPDLSTALLIALIGILMIFCVYSRPSLVAGVLLLGLAVVSYQVVFTPYRLKRVVAFMNPGEHELGSGYQVLQSKISLGSGGIQGLGLGQSRQKFFYLPEEHTDFIFAVLGEEFGFIGAMLVLLAFFLLMSRGLKIARRAPDRLGQLIAFGITGFIIMQVLINMAVVVGLIPPTGVPLPFLSYGGSAMITNLTAMGILLNISAQCAPMNEKHLNLEEVNS